MLENIFKFFRKQENSKDLAKERLKLVLVHDKANVSPQFLEMVKGEIIEVIKKYMEIDEESLDIQLTKEKSDSGDRIVPALVANIPILNVKIGAEPKKNDKEEAAEKKDEIKKEEPKVEKTEVKKEPKTKATKKTTGKVQSKTTKKE